MAVDSPGPDGTLIFLHIPKTGGRTLTTVLRRQYGASRVFETYSSPPDIRIDEYRSLSVEQKRQFRAIAGHVDIDMHLSVPGPSVYITMLRDPLRRVVSAYRYIRRHKGDPLHQSFLDPAMTLERALRSGLNQMFDNGQTRALSGMDAPYGCCDRSMLEAAIQAINEKIEVAGLVEHFDASLLLMKQALNWPAAGYRRHNVAPRPTTLAELSRSELEAIRRLNELDCALYEHVSRMLMPRMTQAKFRRQVVAFQLRNSIRDGRGRLAASVRRLRARASIHLQHEAVAHTIELMNRNDHAVK